MTLNLACSSRRSYATILSALLLSFLPRADAAGWSGLADVLEIQFGPSNVYVRLDPAQASNVNTCSNWFGYFNLSPGGTSLTDFEQSMVAAAIAAKAGGQQASIYSSGCDAGDYNALDYIILK